MLLYLLFNYYGAKLYVPVLRFFNRLYSEFAAGAVLHIVKDAIPDAAR
jgi:hypothetical protein